MLRSLVAACILVFLFGAIYAQPWDCRFALNYTQEQLLTSESARQSFIRQVLHWEGQFNTNGAGMNFPSGLTYDGHPLDYFTGNITGEPHLFSAPSKESLQVNVLTHVLAGTPHAYLFISDDPDQAKNITLQILENKISSYEGFNKLFPGFGGFFPWFTPNSTEPYMVPTNGWTNQVPSLDNGELIWALSALTYILNDINETQLAQRYQAQMDLMTKNAMLVFWQGFGRVRTVTLISNTSAQPSPAIYSQAPCSDPCYLDDPYEGELFVDWLTLFGNLTKDQIEDMWTLKLKKLQSVDYVTPEGNITCQRGWWFSAHEQWKYLALPYLDVPINRRVFENGERARTWNSYLNSIPGMYASVNDVAPIGQPIPTYVSATGIQEIAFENVTYYDVVTGYSAFPLLLINQSYGLAWYHMYLSGPRMQGPIGATEAINVTGTAISPLTTWDSKIPTVNAILGGVAHINREVLKLKGVYEDFYNRINDQWSKIFHKLEGEDLPFMLPSAQLPNDAMPFGPDFTLCQPPK